MQGLDEERPLGLALHGATEAIAERSDGLAGGAAGGVEAVAHGDAGFERAAGLLEGGVAGLSLLRLTVTCCGLVYVWSLSSSMIVRSGRVSGVKRAEFATLLVVLMAEAVS